MIHSHHTMISHKWQEKRNEFLENTAVRPAHPLSPTHKNPSPSSASCVEGKMWRRSFHFQDVCQKGNGSPNPLNRWKYRKLFVESVLFPFSVITDSQIPCMVVVL